METGFNHNIRHRGLLFHVQTEDQGLQNPTIVTHLFLGGNIIATRRSSYEKFVSKPTVKEIVVAMMQEQHKNMLKDLVHDRIKAVLDMMEASVPSPFQTNPIPRTPTSQPPTSTKPKTTSYSPFQMDVPTLDTSSTKDKTLDELILDFLSGDQKKTS